MEKTVKKNKLCKSLPFRQISPAKFPFFYGWIIVFISTLGMLASIPGQTMGVGVFTDFLINSMAVNRVQISTAYMIGTIGSSFILPFAGKWLDRMGIRAMTLIVSIGLGSSLVLLSRAPLFQKRMFSGSFLFTMIILSILFLFIRFFGQGCLAMISRVAIGKWFNHHRGLASAISGVFVSLGFNSSPVFLNNLVQSYGWQTTLVILATGIGVGMGVLGWIFYRDNPEACGLKMDGNLGEEKVARFEARIPPTKKEFTKSQAIRTLGFWSFSLGMAVVALVMTAVTFHISSIGAEQGLTRDQSYLVFFWIFPFSIISNFFCNWISDRIQHKWLLMVTMIAQIAALLGLLIFEQVSGRILFSIGQGIAGGMFVALATVVFPRFFGRDHLGEISGFYMSILVFASAIGPVLFSAFRTFSGSYKMIFLFSILMPLGILLTCFKANNPQLDID
ncbi:MFS transporter [candidate division KSB1 bacterium]|nr:MFS transporter [candidate division KSB1 bacterium]